MVEGTSRAIAWDVVEESLDEAEFLWKRWEDALASHDLDLTRLEDNLEDRLVGALDGLGVGGDEAIDRLLAEALEGDASERVAAVAHAIAAEASPRGLECLGAAWRSAAEKKPSAKLSSLRRAIELIEAPQLLPALRAGLAGAPPEALAALLDVARFRQLDPGPEVAVWAKGDGLAGDSPALRCAALAASRYAPLAVAGACVEHGLRADDPAVRAAAIEVGVLLGMRAAWNACQAAIADCTPGCAPLLTLAATVGSARDHARLTAAVADPALRREAVRAIGSAGWLAGADLCVDLINQGIEPQLAGEALCTISGLDLETEKLVAPAPPDDDSDAAAGDEAAGGGEEAALSGPDRRLPLPDAAGVADWWKRRRTALDGGRRYLGGRPRDADALQALLERGPLRRRHAAALELAVRTGGRYAVATTAFSREQRRALAGFVALDVRRRAHGDWAPTA